MRTTLEALEAKSGRIHTLADWRVAAEKDPAELTDLDFAIIDYFSGAKAAATARDARTKALAPAAIETKAIPVPAATRAAHAARLPTLDGADFSTAAGLAAWVGNNELAAVPLIVWGHFVTTAREKRLALEQRVAALEARPAPGVEYAGTHEVGKAYPGGQLVTKGGGLWLSLRATNQTPGMDPLNWKLIVKSGAA